MYMYVYMNRYAEWLGISIWNLTSMELEFWFIVMVMLIQTLLFQPFIVIQKKLPIWLCLFVEWLRFLIVEIWYFIERERKERIEEECKQSYKKDRWKSRDRVPKYKQTVTRKYPSLIFLDTEAHIDLFLFCFSMKVSASCHKKETKINKNSL